MRKKTKRNNPDEVIITCPKCEHQHHYASIDMLDNIPNTTPCENCGFLFLDHISKKLRATTNLLESDPNARALLDASDFEKFNEYLEKKTGLF